MTKPACWHQQYLIVVAYGQGTHAATLGSCNTLADYLAISGLRPNLSLFRYLAESTHDLPHIKEDVKGARHCLTGLARTLGQLFTGGPPDMRSVRDALRPPQAHVVIAC